MPFHVIWVQELKLKIWYIEALSSIAIFWNNSSFRLLFHDFGGTEIFTINFLATVQYTIISANQGDQNGRSFPDFYQKMHFVKQVNKKMVDRNTYFCFAE